MYNGAGTGPSVDVGGAHREAGLAGARDGLDGVRLEVDAADGVVQRVRDVDAAGVVDRDAASGRRIAAGGEAELCLQRIAAVARIAGGAVARHRADDAVSVNEADALVALVEEVHAAVVLHRRR